MKLDAHRLFAIAAAIVALVAYYVPALPDALILGLIAAILGVGITPGWPNEPTA